MKNKKVLYGSILIIIIIGVLFIALSMKNKGESTKIDYDKEYTKQDINNYSYVYISDYNDYKRYIEDAKVNNVTLVGNELDEDKFNGSRYLLLNIKSDECHESINYSNLKYEDNAYKIYFNVFNKCNTCGDKVFLHQIKVGASSTDKLNIFYKTISEEECN